MVSKLIVFATLVCAAAAAPHHAFSSQHVHKHDGHHTEVEVHDKHGHKHYDYYTPPKYEFGYKVKDEHTKDHKEQHETRHDDEVKGHYVVQDPHGSLRDIHYHSDKHSGFHANFKHEVHHVVPKHHHH